LHVWNGFADGVVERLYLAVHTHGSGTIGDPNEVKGPAGKGATWQLAHGQDLLPEWL